jgi:tRNA-specific 2-thiouridylase
MKAISLFSGGLDSIVATRVLTEQGIEMEALHFRLVFVSGEDEKWSDTDSNKVEGILGARLKIWDVSEEFLEVVKHPKHGYGSNMNPCIDCKIFMLKKAKEYMKTVGASFLVTGEVLGERPMSQGKNMMRHIEREADLDGLILRPLSAKFLPPSVPEKEGWVDREKMFNIQGRSRKPQIELAEQYGIPDYPTPAGGCLLTIPGFAKRMKDLLAHQPDFSLNDVHLLKVGRHFRFSPKTKLIVGRKEEENQKIQTFSREGDLLFGLARHPGPLSLLRGEPEAGEIEKAAAITARYSRSKDLKNAEVIFWKVSEETRRSLIVSPVLETEIEGMMIYE